MTHNEVSTETLLNRVDGARRQNRGPDMAAAVAALVRLGVYPETSGIGLPALRMVEFYGADWHVYREPLRCGVCSADLRDLQHGPPFKREVVQIDRDLDRQTGIICPDCHASIA